MVGSVITLFESTATQFDTNGIGTLPDAITCPVKEQMSSLFELSMTYPIWGRNFEELKLRRIIGTKTHPYSNIQGFRIYEISKPINGIVTVSAEHISYDMSGIPVMPFSASTVNVALQELKANTLGENIFTFHTDKITAGEFSINVPRSMRSILGGETPSLLEIYHGEYEFDNFSTTLWDSRGEDKGVTIRYGKNLIDMTQEENCVNVYTGVYPYWQNDEDGSIIDLPEKIVATPGTYDYSRILIFNVNEFFDYDEVPTVESIRYLTEQYISSQNLGIPEVSLTVSFVDLSKTMSASEVSIMEQVRIGDTLTVEFPKMGVSTSARCRTTVYDAVKDEYETLELGSTYSTLSSRLIQVSSKVEALPTESKISAAIKNATTLITGGQGGHVVIHNSQGGEQPDEILILDEPSIFEAVNVWRWNKNGLGFSSNGYAGPFDLAITKDGKVMAKFLYGLVVTAAMIETGALNADSVYIGGPNDPQLTVKDFVDTQITENDRFYDAIISAIESSEGYADSLFEEIDKVGDRIHIAYANKDYEGNITDFSTTVPTGREYIGLYINVADENPTDPSLYTWSLFKGANGVTTYTWYKYADTITGTGMSDNPTGKRYLGMAFNQTSAVPGTVASVYKWTPLYDNVEVGGVNLLIRTNETKGKRIENTGAIINSSAQSLSDYIPVTAGQQYAVSVDDTSNWVRLAWYNENQEFILYNGFDTANKVYTVPESVAYVRLSYLTAAKVKFEKGNLATAWSASPEDLVYEYMNQNALLSEALQRAYEDYTANEYRKLELEAKAYADNKLTLEEANDIFAAQAAVDQALQGIVDAKTNLKEWADSKFTTTETLQTYLRSYPAYLEVGQISNNPEIANTTTRYTGSGLKILTGEYEVAEFGKDGLHTPNARVDEVLQIGNRPAGNHAWVSENDGGLTLMWLGGSS